MDTGVAVVDRELSGALAGETYGVEAGKAGKAGEAESRETCGAGVPLTASFKLPYLQSYAPQGLVSDSLPPPQVPSLSSLGLNLISLHMFSHSNPVPLQSCATRCDTTYVKSVESYRSYWTLCTQLHSKEERIECPVKSPNYQEIPDSIPVAFERTFELTSEPLDNSTLT
jgi:hypothetical protein